MHTTAVVQAAEASSFGWSKVQYDPARPNRITVLASLVLQAAVPRMIIFGSLLDHHNANDDFNYSGHLSHSPASLIQVQRPERPAELRYGSRAVELKASFDQVQSDCSGDLSLGLYMQYVFVLTEKNCGHTFFASGF